MEAQPPSILILTASFGEGHNAAARALAATLEQQAGNTVETQVVDVLTEINPSVQKFLLKTYNYATTKAPHLWYKFFQVTEKVEPSSVSLELLHSIKRDLRKRLVEHEPRAVICTYMVYDLLIEKIYKDQEIPFPVYVVITDSVNIHASWLHGPAQKYFVTDHWTRGLLEQEEVEADRILDLGFPIRPDFSLRKPDEPLQDPELGPSILYFATTKKKHVREMLEGIAEWKEPRKRITVLLGKHEERLRSTVEKAVEEDFENGQVTILGWTDQVPELMQSHHLIISKAGGATVHEAMAAGTPMCIVGTIPGQEEGNVTLLQRAHAGIEISRPDQLTVQLDMLFGDQAEMWRELRRNTARIGKPNAAAEIVQFVLEDAGLVVEEQPHESA